MLKKKENKICVIIPVFNEDAIIEESFNSIKEIKIYSAEYYFSNRFKMFSKVFAKTNATYSTLVASPKYILLFFLKNSGF